MAIVVANRTAQSGTYYTGTPNYVDVSAGTAEAGMVTFSAKATDASWDDGVEIGVVVVKDDDNWQVWRATWDETNEYLEVVEVEDSAGTLSNADAVTVTATLTEAHMQKLINGREVLTADRTYYVRTDGSDSNSGLVDSAGGAFLTIQKALNVAGELNLGGYTCTVQVRSGTYALSSGAGNIIKPPTGSGTLAIVGDTTTPSNIIVTTSVALTDAELGNGGLFTLKNPSTCKVTLGGFQLTSTATTGTAVFYVLVSAATLYITGAMDFGSANTAVSIQHIRAQNTGNVFINTNYTISGNASNHWTLNTNATLKMQSRTVTISGSPVISTFANVDIGAVIIVNGNTFSGSLGATSIRYSVSTNGVIHTYGAGATYLPGNVAGTTATGGQYA